MGLRPHRSKIHLHWNRCDRSITGWDIVINNTPIHGVNFLAGKPSQNFDVAEFSEYFQYDVILHELMHVMGADHVPPSASPPATTMFAAAGGAGHLATEFDADLWFEGGAIAGDRAVPFADLLFLDAWYPNIDLDTPEQPRLHTWKAFDIGGDWEIHPFGPGFDFSGPTRGTLNLGALCEGDALSPGSATVAAAHMPGMSSLEAGDHSLVIGMRGGNYWAQFEGYAWYETDDLGSMGSTSMFTPPSGGGVDWKLGSFSHHEAFDRTAKLYFFHVDSGRTVELPMQVTMKAACPCDGGVPAPGCCEVECDE